MPEPWAARGVSDCSSQKTAFRAFTALREARSAVSGKSFLKIKQTTEVLVYWTLKLQTCIEPAGEELTSAPHQFKLVTVLCSLRNAKFEPTVSSPPPAGVTKME